MVQALVGAGKKFASVTTLAGVFVLGSLAQQDPPSRVARLNYTGGNVSMQPSGVNDWTPAEINHPFTVGDYLYTDAGARSELHLDIAAIRMGPQTSFGFLNLNDEAVQIKLAEGDMSFRLHHFGPNQVFEVDTPNAAVQLLRDGLYRFRVDPNGSMSFVVVREGQAEITGGGQAFTVNPGNSALISGAEQPAFDVEIAPAPDDFDRWCAGRDAHEAHLASAHYLPPTVIGYEDLDQYGTWQEQGEYGPVWYPRQVAVGWAPYHDGHWAWVEPWGWTWVDSAPWGFAPFHYGRWAYLGNRWGWCPGPIAVVGGHGPVVRPYYAPALVAWFSGAHWGVSVSTGPSLGWVPLGFGEVFTPSYACSRPYFHNVNNNNTQIVKTVNITNVYNTVYVNKTVYNQQYVNVRAPHAVYAMRQSAFASGQPVHEGGYAVPEADLRQAGGSALVLSPGVAPTRQAILARGEGSAVRPLPQVMNRQVVGLHTPAAAPVSFAARQQYLQSHAGQIHNFAAMHAEVAAPVSQPQAIRPVAAVQPVQAQPGQHWGQHPAAFAGHSDPPSQHPLSPVRPQVQAPPAQPLPVQQAARPASQQAAHRLPPDQRPFAHPEANRNEHFHEQRPAEHPPSPPAQPPQEHPAFHPEMQQHNQPPMQHAAQPSPPPPVNHGSEHHDQPPEHNRDEHKSGEHHDGNHNEHKSQ